VREGFPDPCPCSPQPSRPALPREGARAAHERAPRRSVPLSQRLSPHLARSNGRSIGAGLLRGGAGRAATTTPLQSIGNLRSSRAALLPRTSRASHDAQQTLTERATRQAAAAPSSSSSCSCSSWSCRSSWPCPASPARPPPPPTAAAAAAARTSARQPVSPRGPRVLAPPRPPPPPPLNVPAGAAAERLLDGPQLTAPGTACADRSPGRAGPGRSGARGLRPARAQ
jgi:hypothetical protein